MSSGKHPGISKENTTTYLCKGPDGRSKVPKNKTKQKSFTGRLFKDDLTLPPEEYRNKGPSNFVFLHLISLLETVSRKEKGGTVCTLRDVFSWEEGP